MTSANNKSKKREGITLLEILISVSVLVVMAAVLVPQFFNFYDQQSLKDDASKVAFALQNARDKAKNGENGSDWGVHFTATLPLSSQDYFVVFSGSSFAGGQAQQTVTLNPSNKFNTHGAGFRQDIIFSKITGLPDAPANIIISSINDASASSTVSVSSVGEIRN